MRPIKTGFVMLAAGVLAAGPGTALASTAAAKAPEGARPASQAVAPAPAARPGERRVRGEVTAVEPNAKTIVVKVMEGKKELIVGAEVTEKTSIREGNAHKILANIKVGEHVWMKYDRMSDKLVADGIHILKPHGVAAKR